jgi:hypothetical protein
VTSSTGLCFIFVLAGSFPRKLSPFQFFDGLMGLETNPHHSLVRQAYRKAADVSITP